LELHPDHVDVVRETQRILTVISTHGEESDPSEISVGSAETWNDRRLGRVLGVRYQDFSDIVVPGYPCREASGHG